METIDHTYRILMMFTYVCAGALVVLLSTAFHVMGESMTLPRMAPVPVPTHDLGILGPAPSPLNF